MPKQYIPREEPEIEEAGEYLFFRFYIPDYNLQGRPVPISVKTASKLSPLQLLGPEYPDPRYNPNYDINNDGKIDMINDIRTVAKQFGKIDP